MGVSLDNLNDYSEQNIQNLVLACAIYSIDTQVATDRKDELGVRGIEEMYTVD